MRWCFFDSHGNGITCGDHTTISPIVCQFNLSHSWLLLGGYSPAQWGPRQTNDNGCWTLPLISSVADAGTTMDCHRFYMPTCTDAMWQTGYGTNLVSEKWQHTCWCRDLLMPSLFKTVWPAACPMMQSGVPRADCNWMPTRQRRCGSSRVPILPNFNASTSCSKSDPATFSPAGSFVIWASTWTRSSLTIKQHIAKTATACFYHIHRLHQYLVDCCVPVSDITSHRRLCSPRHCLLTIPHHWHSTLDHQAFSITRPTAWNLLTEQFRDSHCTESAFWQLLKTFFFNQY